MFKRFLRNTDGNVLLTSALSIPVLLVGAGVSIDMAELYRAKTSYQAAVDAAALAAAKILSKSGNGPHAESYGAKVFQANVENLPHSSAAIDIDVGNGDCSSQGVVATATLTHPMLMSNFSGAFADNGGYANFEVSSTVKCGGDTVEIALVLDNSGSMRYNNKLTTLKAASKNLVNSLHDSMGNFPVPKPIQFSVVPFSGMVNVGSNNKNASWMDTQGRSPVHHEHLDWGNDPNALKVGDVWKNTAGQTLSRFKLYDEMNISWKGCVEMRPHPYHTQDTTPSVGTPASLFVPSFAPDTPDNYSGQRETRNNPGGATYWCTRWGSGRRNRHKCRRWNDGWSRNRHWTGIYANRYGGDYDSRGNYIGSSGSVTYGNIISEQWYQNNYLADNHNLPNNRPHHLDPDNTGTGTDQYGRQRWTWKYFDNPNPRDINNNRSGLPSVVGTPGGPNMFCTSRPLTPLTTSRNTALNALNNMIADGSTNVSQGIGWGWRTLSKAAPFTGGRDYSAADNKKVMIVMTDGNNTYYPIDTFYNGYSKMNPAYYSAYAANGGQYATNPAPKRLFEGFDAIANPNDTFDTYRKAMDEHMLETCTNVKNSGIQIYTIAFDVPNGSSVKTMLQTCASKDASNTPLYYDAANNSQLVQAFESIAEKIADLSLTH